ncbi:MAG: Tim44/TimA family putative adaptor protein [Alphaproteobacteria bacterium]
MGGGYLDIIIFAMVAVFLIFKLGSVLGRRTGNEQQRPGPFRPMGREAPAPAEAQDNVVALPDRSGEAPAAAPATPLAAGLAQIKIADPGFEEKEFLAGVRAAFEMIVAAFAAGDEGTLRNLLNDEVFANFKRAIDARNAAGRRQETTLVGFNAVDIVEAAMQDRRAVVTIKIVSDQINLVRDAEGKTVEGDPDNPVEIVDIWSFARDTRSSDPNWVLIGTRSPN